MYKTYAWADWWLLLVLNIAMGVTAYTGSKCEMSAPVFTGSEGAPLPIRPFFTIYLSQTAHHLWYTLYKRLSSFPGAPGVTLPSWTGGPQAGSVVVPCMLAFSLSYGWNKMSREKGSLRGYLILRFVINLEQLHEAVFNSVNFKPLLS